MVGSFEETPFLRKRWGFPISKTKHYFKFEISRRWRK
jgi:hypothetical protein